MDAFVKLVVVLVRYSGDPTNTVTRINLLNKVKGMAFGSHPCANVQDSDNDNSLNRFP